nr:MAG TPA: hypothetical protein [Caudoviricetes sp.]
MQDWRCSAAPKRVNSTPLPPVSTGDGAVRKAFSDAGLEID